MKLCVVCQGMSARAVADVSLMILSLIVSGVWAAVLQRIGQLRNTALFSKLVLSRNDDLDLFFKKPM